MQNDRLAFISDHQFVSRLSRWCLVSSGHKLNGQSWFQVTSQHFSWTCWNFIDYYWRLQTDIYFPSVVPCWRYYGVYWSKSDATEGLDMLLLDVIYELHPAIVGHVSLAHLCEKKCVIKNHLFFFWRIAVWQRAFWTHGQIMHSCFRKPCLLLPLHNVTVCCTSALLVCCMHMDWFECFGTTVTTVWFIFELFFFFFLVLQQRGSFH